MDSKPSKGHILAVDNSEEVLDVFRLLLEEEGYRVTTYKYVFKDMAEVRELKPDLIILDYMWHEEDGGWSMLQMLKMDRVTGPIPIILYTGAKREVDDLGDHLTQMDVTVILKPFDIFTLLEAISKRLDGTGFGQIDGQPRAAPAERDQPPIRAVSRPETLDPQARTE